MIFTVTRYLPLEISGKAVDGENVAVLSDHLVGLHRVASLGHHPVGGLAVGVAMELPGVHRVRMRNYSHIGQTFIQTELQTKTDRMTENI